MSTTPYRPFSTNAERILKQRYFHPGEDWPALVRRVVNAVCKHEPTYYKEEVYATLLDRVWLPNSPCLAGAGTQYGMFACFTVGPREDDLAAHVDTLQQISLVAKAGGGCGFTGTFIRPKGSPVGGSAHGFAYGPNPWAVQVSDYLSMITQGGFRKMALMYTLSIYHKDILEFIDLKQHDETTGQRFNQSVMVPDDFMEAAQVPGSEESELLNLIARAAWNNGEPGILFYDRINRHTPYRTMCDAECGYPIEVTNPCGEQPLPDYGSCNLASINLAHDQFFSPDGSYNWERLEDMALTVTRFLDNVGSANNFPSPMFEDWYEDHRPVGLGIMGYADALLRLGMAYGSDEALQFLTDVLGTLYDYAESESVRLALERGTPRHCEQVRRRNITLLTVAPTGSISFIADCSSGIEPHFDADYTRVDERGQHYVVKHPRADDPNFRSAVNADEAKRVTVDEHIDTQATAQLIIDSGVSKTINLPEEATPEEIRDAYIKAYERGCKGITVYRNNSRQVQVLNVNKPKEDRDLQDSKNAPKRPETLPCTIHKAKSNGHNWYILIGLYGDEPFEVFAVKTGRHLGQDTGIIKKNGRGSYDLLNENGTTLLADLSGWTDTDEERAITRLLSLSLRHGVPIKFVVEQLAKTGGSVVAFTKAINRVLLKHLPENTAIKCSNCGSPSLAVEEGCLNCKNCGFSACG